MSLTVEPVEPTQKAVEEAEAALLAQNKTERTGSRRSDLTIGALAMFMQMGTGLVMLPATAVFLTPAQLTFWSVFLTIQVLNSMLEFGFSPTFARNFTYIFSGASALTREGVPDRKSSACDLQVLRNLISASRGLYAKLAAASFLLLATIGTLYLWRLSQHLPDVSLVWPAWGVLLLAHPLMTFTQWQYAMLLGADRVRSFYVTVIVSRLTQVVFSVACLMIWQNIFVLALGYAASMIVFRAMGSLYIRDIMKSVAGLVPQREKAREMVSLVAHNAWKVGWVTLGVFLANRFNLLSFSMFLGAEASAEYAIASQALNVLASVSLVGVSMLTPMMAGAHVRRDQALLRESLSFVNLSALVIFIVGFGGLLITGDWLLGAINSKTMLPAVGVLCLLGLVYWLEAQVTISTQFIMTGNRVPHLRAMIATGGLVALSVMAAGSLGGNLTTLLLVQCGIMLAYNAWRWPLEASREVGINFSNFLPGAMAGAKRILFGRRGAAAGVST